MGHVCQFCNHCQRETESLHGDCVKCGLSKPPLDEGEAKAIERANSLEKSEFSCPRGVVNPGIYFGHKMGWQDAMTSVENDVRVYQDEILKLRSQLVELQNELGTDEEEG